MKTYLYHNPRCGTSRKVYQYLKEKDFDVVVIDYLNNVPSAAEYEELIDRLENPDMILRKKQEEYRRMDPKPISKAEIAKKMNAFPIIQERPIVQIDGTAVVARPYDFFLDWIAKYE